MKVLPFIESLDIANAAEVAAAHLDAGGLLAYPTETVYGFGCTLRPEALTRLSALKLGREGKAFLLLIRDVEDVSGLHWNDPAVALANEFWPGPLTLALRTEEGRFPPEVLGPGGLVALRVSPHPGLQVLMNLLREPLTSTSANLPGTPPRSSGDDVARLLENAGQSDTLVLDGGRLAPSPSSTLVDCSERIPRVLREGAISLKELRRCVHDIRI